MCFRLRALGSPVTMAIGAQEREEMGMISTWKIPPGDIRQALRHMLESVQILQQPFEKQDWVARGVLPLLIKVLVRNGNVDTFNQNPIRISRHLVDGNQEGAAEFAKLCIECIETNWEAVGIYGAGTHSFLMY